MPSEIYDIIKKYRNPLEVYGLNKKNKKRQDSTPVEDNHEKRLTTKGKSTTSLFNSEPRKFDPSVIHKDRKVECFIEKCEPKLVNCLDSWKHLKIDPSYRQQVFAQHTLYMQQLERRARELNKPKKLPIKQQIRVRNLSTKLGGLIDHTKLEKYAYKLHQSRMAKKAYQLTDTDAD